MATVRDCTTPEEGWSLYSHFIGNLLLVVSVNSEILKKETGNQKNMRERVIYSAWAELVGNLYMVMCRVRKNGHDEEADKMQQIVDMVVEEDLTNPEVVKRVNARHFELNTGLRKFTEELEKLRAERGLKKQE